MLQRHCGTEVQDHAEVGRSSHLSLCLGEVPAENHKPCLIEGLTLDSASFGKVKLILLMTGKNIREDHDGGRRTAYGVELCCRHPLPRGVTA